MKNFIIYLIYEVKFVSKIVFRKTVVDELEQRRDSGGEKGS